MNAWSEARSQQWYYFKDYEPITEKKNHKINSTQNGYSSIFKEEENAMKYKVTAMFCVHRRGKTPPVVDFPFEELCQ